MPYCETCAKYWTPSSVNTDGTCRTCGARLAADDHADRAAVATDEADVASRDADGFHPGGLDGDGLDGDGLDGDGLDGDGLDGDGLDEDDKVPWHFKLMIVALVIYLGWRFVQLGIAIFT